jgi:hypothetical protein
VEKRREKRQKQQNAPMAIADIMTANNASNRQLQHRSSSQHEVGKHRDDLFTKRRKKSSTTASEAQSIQKSLMRTQNLLQNELQRVSHLGSAIEEDGNVLQQTMNHHKSLNTKKAQQALTSLERAQRQEQRILLVSTLFFCLVAFFVMWSRVLIKFDFISVLWSGWK